MKYDVTVSQFEEIVKKTIDYYEDGDVIIVHNKLTGISEEYAVETKKVLTKKPNWSEK